MVKNYVANFHLTEEYQSFVLIEGLDIMKWQCRWKSFFPELNIAKLRIKYSDEVPQILVKEIAEGEVG